MSAVTNYLGAKPILANPMQAKPNQSWAEHSWILACYSIDSIYGILGMGIYDHFSICLFDTSGFLCQIGHWIKCDN